MLGEYELDENANGWFRPPWKNGWNAVGLCAFGEIYDGKETLFCRQIFEQARQRPIGACDYWEAQDLLRADLSLRAPLAAAGLRCVQLACAKSDGGGVVYNDVLRRTFAESGFDERYSRLHIQTIVREYRCRDSIGTTAVLQNDRNDRQRRAFCIAWDRGLYLAAYALPPVF